MDPSLREVDPAFLTDASGYRGWADRAYAPRHEDEICDVLKEAAAKGIPVTLAGAGSGLTGARVPQGGWVLSLQHFSGLEIREGSARAGSAVTLQQLREKAAGTGQFYAPDPTEITASVGGTIATDASGSRSFRFGSTRQHVLALRVALTDGRIVEYRRGDKVDFPLPAIRRPSTSKNTAGYYLAPAMDWIDLICGSEGTLAVVLEAELRLLPIPPDLFAGIIFFSSDDDAIAAVDAWRPLEELRMLEYLDRNSLTLLRTRYSEIPRQAATALLIESDSADLDAWEQRLDTAKALLEHSWFATSATDRERFRRIRHSLPELVNDTVRSRGLLKMGTDYAVPVECSREMLAFYRATLDATLPDQYVIFGHIGDAHLHVNMLPETGDQAELAARLLTEFAKKAVALGGTVSAEHGLGKRKAHLLALQYSAEEIEAMRAVKRRLDPRWILGRGTLFPSDSPV